MKYFFIHIPKTGGTSLAEYLNKNLNKNSILSIYPSHEGRYNCTSLDNLRKNPSKYKNNEYFIGHFHYGLHEILSLDPEQCRYVTFLRNPVDRVVSLYKHFLKHPSPEHDLIVAEQLSLLDFLQRPQLNIQGINFMTGMIAGQQIDFKKAIENIDNHFMYIGCMENYQQSVTELCDIFGWKNRQSIHNNKTLVKDSLLDNDGVIEKTIIDMNQYDIELYQYCRSKYNQNPLKVNKQLTTPIFGVIWRFMLKKLT